MKFTKVHYNPFAKSAELQLSIETTESQKEILSSIRLNQEANLCFNESISLHINGELNYDAMKDALNKILSRHSALRASFSKDFKYMLVPFNQNLDLEFINLESKGNDDKESIILNYISNDTSTLFDLENGPLVRFKILKKSNDQYIIILSAHHLVCDGWSWAVILDDLGYYYNQFLIGNDKERVTPYQFWQYAISLDNKKNEIKSQKEYWVNLYKKSIPRLDLPTDFIRNEERTFNSKRHDHAIPKDLVAKIRSYSRKNGVNFYSTLYSAYLILINKLTKEKDIVVGISAAAQSILGESSLVGHCVNLLPIRNTISSSDSINDFIKKISCNILDAVDNQEFTFGSLLKELPLERDLSRIPLVSVIFNIDLQPVGQGLNFEGLVCHFETNPRQFENFEMFINATVCGDNVVIENQYNTSLFSDYTIKSWMNSYQEILKVFVLNENELLDELNIAIHIPHEIVQEAVVNEKNTTEYSPEVFEVIKEVSQELLAVNNITSEDNFFHLGGHSLLAGELMLELNRKYNYKLTLKDIFNAKSFAEISSACSVDQLNDVSLNPLQRSKSKSKTTELSIQQFRAWYVQTLNPKSTIFNLPSFRKLGKELKIDSFQRALQEFMDRHLLTQSNVVVESGFPKLKLSTHDIDLNVNKEFKTEADLINHFRNKTSKQIDLAKDPLFNPSLYQTKDGEFYLCILIHHLIWDGWCYDLFQKEVTSLYKKYLDLPYDELYSTELNYFDYCEWQKTMVASQTVLEQKKYWMNTLSGELPVLDLPIDYARPAIVDFSGESLFITWNELEVQKLEDVAKKFNTTLFNVLLTGINILLSKYTSSNDIIVGMPVQGRHWNELNNLIGFFASNIAIRSKVEPDKSFAYNLLRIKDQVSSAYSNSDIPFDSVVRELKVPRDTSRTPVYQCFFMYQDATNRAEGLHDLPYKTIPVERGACHTDLDFWARRDTEGMAGGLDFMKSLFSKVTIERIAEDFKSILKIFSEYPESIINESSLISKNNTIRLLNQYNNTSLRLPDSATVHKLFEEQVNQNPSKECVFDKTKSLSYLELNNRANQLARYLREQGMKENELVGIAINRSVELFIATLAVWKAGGGYIPLDPEYPEERLSYMVSHSETKRVITNEKYQYKSSFDSLEKIFIDKIDLTNFDKDNLDLNYSYDQNCYVIYTSGSTGTPKGVQLGHKGVVNFLLSMNSRPGIEKEDVLCAITTLSFDISVLELFFPLISGASVVIVEREVSMFGDELMKVFQKYKVSIMQATPASWRLLLHSGWKGGESFKVLCGGEPFPEDLARSLVSICHSVWNMYGPTETTVWSTCKKINIDDPKILIGRPINNTKIYILDNNLKLLPQGVIGNLYIGGVGLAKGYLNSPSLTKERFIASPFDNSETIYDTGDLARYTNNGDIECLGRNDGQVKLRGYRIELGEIESSISKFSGISNQVVILREDRPGDVRLVAYYISNQEIDESSLKTHLNTLLPPYMIPAHFVRLDKFPMTLNGKIDRKKLPLPIKQKPFDSTKELTGLTKIEAQMHKIWCDLLQVNSIGIHDNFFDIGGYSVLSVDLFSRILDTYRVNLPLSTLFDHGSIHSLSSYIESSLKEESQEDILGDVIITSQHSLILMRKGNGGRPVFFFHGVGGNVLNYRILFKSIPPDRPIYGLQSPGIDGTTSMATDFKEMIQNYALEIMSLCPSGPYTLIGGSMGGVIALEVARFLKDQDETIDQLIMFDTFGPRSNLNINPEKVNFFPRLITMLNRKKIDYKCRLWELYYKLLGKTIPHELRFYFIEKNNFKLFYDHEIKYYDDHIILIRGEKKEFGNASEEQLGWSDIAKGIEVYYTDANHNNIIENKGARKLLSKILNRS